MISVLVLEDNAVLCKKLVRTLSGWHFISKVYSCDSNFEAKNIIETNFVDLLIVDLNVADGDGIDTIKYSKLKNQVMPIIVTSAVTEPSRIIAAIQAGAIGYIHKSDSSIEIEFAIDKVLKGQSPISAEIAYILCQRVKDSGLIKVEKQQDILTDRELEVLTLISKGLSNVEISDILEISKNTVPVHVRNIYKKLQSSNRTEAVYEARSMGISL